MGTRALGEEKRTTKRPGDKFRHEREKREREEKKAEDRENHRGKAYAAKRERDWDKETRDG